MWGFAVNKKGMGEVPPPPRSSPLVLRFTLKIFIPPKAPYAAAIQGLCGGPTRDQHVKWTQSHPIPWIKTKDTSIVLEMWILKIYMLSLCSSVLGQNSCTAAGYGMDGRGAGLQVPLRARLFCSRRLDRFLVLRNSYPMGNGRLFCRGLKRQGREASAEVRNT
jgi:hypothetical protein